MELGIGILQYKEEILDFYDTQERRVSGESQFAHLSRVRDTLRYSSKSKELSPGFELGIYIHDIVDRSINSSDKLVKEQNDLILKTVLSDVAKYNPEMAVYAYGIAYSSCRYEIAARRWRGTLNRAISDDKESSLDFLREQIAVIDQEDGERNLPQKLSAVLTDHSSALVDSEIKKFVSPVADIGDMLNMHDLYDIEGLQLAAAGMMDNVKNPNPDKPASTWKDSQELLSFLGPLLEIAGLNDLARECYSTAFEYIHAESQLMPRAQDIYSKANELFNKPEFEGNISTSIMESIQEQLRILNKDSSIYTTSRVKKTGSIVKKLIAKYSRFKNLPDTIGYRAELDSEDLTAQDMMSIAQKILDNILQRDPHILPAHINPEDPCIQANYDGLKQEASSLILSGKKITVSQEGPRPEGYEAIHINFLYDLNTNRKTSAASDKVGIEIQLLQRSKHLENTYGIASHIFYKLRNGFGEVGNICRKFFANPEQNREAFKGVVGQFRNKFQKVFYRTAYFENHVNVKNSNDFKLALPVTEVARDTFEKLGIHIDEKVYKSLNFNGERNLYFPEP